MFKICSLAVPTIPTNDKIAYAFLEEMLAKHRNTLDLLVSTTDTERKEYIFFDRFNAQVSLSTYDSDSPDNTKKILLLLLYNALKSLLCCSDIVLYQVSSDHINGETQDDYIWVSTLFSESHHGSRTDAHIIDNGPDQDKEVELLDIHLIKGDDDFSFKHVIEPIQLNAGVMYAEIAAIVDKKGNTLETKKIEVSGINGGTQKEPNDKNAEHGNFDPVAIRIRATSFLARRVEELNQINSPNSIETDETGKTTAIVYEETNSDTSASKRYLHSANIQELIVLLKNKITKQPNKYKPEILSDLFNALFKERIMLEVDREQEFNGIAGRSIIAMAHNTNYNIKRIIKALQNGKTLEVKDGRIYIQGKPLACFKDNPQLLKARTHGARSFIQDVHNMIHENRLKRIREQARSFEMQKSKIIKKELNKLPYSPLSDLQVCFFEPIPIEKVGLLMSKQRNEAFLEFVKTNKMLLTTDQGTFLDIRTLSNRSLLLSDFFRGYPPKAFNSLLQPKLRGKIICQPSFTLEGRIQTKVILVFDKPIHNKPEELIKPIFIQDELSDEKTFLDPRLQEDFSPDMVPFFQKSDDGKTLELIIDYDIFTVDRKILFRFCEGVSNSLKYDDNGETKTATDIPNYLLSKGQITTARFSETYIMEFFERILKTRRYEESTNASDNDSPDDSVLGRCQVDQNYKRLVLSYFIRNHIDDIKAYKLLQPLFQKILFRYLILDADDAKFAMEQIVQHEGYKDKKDNKLKDNPFLKAIQLFQKNAVAAKANS